VEIDPGSGIRCDMEFMRVDIPVSECHFTYFQYFSTSMDLPVSGGAWVLVQEGRFWVGNHLFLVGLTREGQNIGRFSIKIGGS